MLLQYCLLGVSNVWPSDGVVSHLEPFAFSPSDGVVSHLQPFAFSPSHLGRF
jgi:hypothetical protein